MQLTLLNTGTDYLNRMIQNRQRLVIAYCALGRDSGYPLTVDMLAFKDNPIKLAVIDVQAISGDTATFQIQLPTDEPLLFGEVALVSTTGIFLAATVLPAPIVKDGQTAMTLTLTVKSVPFVTQLQFVSQKYSLSTTRPDFDDILAQLQAQALQNSQVAGLVTNETGNTQMEMMAGVADFSAYMFESAYQESLPDSAKRASSQYAIQNMLRNRLTRKIPAGGNFTLTRATAAVPLVVQPLTQFTASGALLYNREALQFPTGVTTINCRLYEGQVKTVSLQGGGLDYQFWVSPEKDFTVSDEDVRVTINQAAIPIVQDSLWNYEGKPAVQDSTDNYGKLVLTFGNGSLASRPATTDTVAITYTITQGLAGNDSTFTGQTATYAGQSLTATALTGLSGGGSEPSLTLYQRMGGDLFGGQKGCVTPSQYRAKARDYPGVIDAIVLAQRDLAPMDKNWFNTGKIILLTEQPWTEQDRQAYETWYRNRAMYSMRYQILTGDNGTEPKQRVINVKLILNCRNDTDLVSAEDSATKAVRALFQPRAGILSRPLFRDDINTAIRTIANPELIDYIEILEPTTDIGMDIYLPANPTVVISGGGNLAVGLYHYGIASKDSQGTSSVTTVTVDVTVPNSSITLAWDKVAAASSYIVYGRQVELSALHEQQATSGERQTFTDDGSLVETIGQPPSSINTSGVHYAVLGTLEVTARYSRRGLIEERGYV